MNMKGQMGLYFHWPFCLSKCPYCDFNVHVRSAIDYGRWEAAYLKALEYYAALMPDRVLSTIYFGGGTPSTMPPSLVEAIVDKARSLWRSVNDIEITLEANPTSIEIEKFQAFRDAGVNRVSIGVQALNDKDLKFLGRQHSVAEAEKAIQIARDVFDRFSFDLIYARPEQTLDDWKAELSHAVDLAAGHLSLYQLTIERNTPFYYSFEQGDFTLPEEELAADFYGLTQDILSRVMPAYEVSNHAADGQESKHNLIYWHYGEYIGIGPGAHGRIDVDGRRHATRDHYAPDAWLERVEQNGNGAHPFEFLSEEGRFNESFMMGLRLNDGISLQHLDMQAGGDWGRFIDEKRLETSIEQGWVILDDQKISLSTEGMLRLNALLAFILSTDRRTVQSALPE